MDNVAHHVVETLLRVGLRRVYASAGGCGNALRDEIVADGRLQLLPMPSEAAAAFAAAAETRMTGRLALCLGSCGAANVELLNGLCEARRHGGRVLALMTQVPRPVAGREYFQEMGEEVLRGACDYCCSVGLAAQLPARLHGCLCRALSGAVSALLLPADLYAAPLAPSEGSAVEPAEALSAASPLPPEPDAAQLRRLASLLNRSERVMFLCGSSCRGAEAAISALAESLHAPLAYSLGGKELMEVDEHAVGMIGLLGWGSAPWLLPHCDLLLLWGTDFPYATFLLQASRVVQVDARAEMLGRHVPLLLALHASPRLVAERLLPLLRRPRGEAFFEAAMNLRGKALRRLMAPVCMLDGTAPLRAEYITRLVSDYAEPDAVFVADVGPALLWAARYLQMLGQRRLLGSFRHGARACALAMALGIKSVFPRRQVIVLTDEASLLRQLAELHCICEHGLRVKVLLYRMCSAAAVSCRGKAKSCPVSLSLAATARAVGCRAVSIREPAEALSAVQRCLRSLRSVLLEACVDAHALAAPPLDIWGQSTALPDENGSLDALRHLLFGDRRRYSGRPC